MKHVLFALLFTASVALAEETEEPSADGAEAVVAVTNAPLPQVKFMTLPLCRRLEGTVFVRQPGAKEWGPAVEGRFYPLGTSFRTEGKSRLTVAFASDSTVLMSGDAEFGTRSQPLGVPSRTIVLVRGTLELKLADNLPEGAFFITAPGFVVKNPAGESRYVYEDVGDGDKATVSCKTGSLGIEGRHFEIPAMRSANTVVIRTSRDMLSTFLYGMSGDYTVKLDKNLRLKEEIGDDGKMKRTEEREFAEFRLSPATKVVINRSVPAIGERMSAFIMAFDASGERQGEGIVVCEGRAEINGGDLVAKEKMNGSELAKRAAEATETTETAAESGETSAEGAASENGKETSNETNEEQ